MAEGGKHERSLLLAMIVLVATGGIDLYLRSRTGLLLFQLIGVYILLAIGMCGVVFLRFRFARGAHEEKREVDRVRNTSSGDTSLFGMESGDPFSAIRNFSIIEKHLVPAYTIVAAIIAILYSVRVFRGADVSTMPNEGMLGAAFLIGQAFLFFLFSRFMLGLSRTKTFRIYRGPGIALGLICLISFGAGLAIVCTEFTEFPFHKFAGWITAGILGLLGAESLLVLMFSIFSPRRKYLIGTAYESRLASFITVPDQWAQNVAQTVDYQFGLNIGERFHLRVLKNLVLPIFALTAVVLWLMSTVFFLEPHEQGFIERTGRPLNPETPLDSGMHLKMPWPIDTVRRLPSKRIQTIHVGFDPDKKSVDPMQAMLEDPDVRLWTDPHHDADDPFLVNGGSNNALTGNQVGLISINMPVEVLITNLYDYTYRYQNPEEIFAEIARGILTRELASLDQIGVLSADRRDFGSRIAAQLTEKVEAAQLGLEVVNIGLAGIHPPSSVAAAFQEVVSAIEEREASTLMAKAHSIKIEKEAEAEAEIIRQAAETDRLRIVSEAESLAYEFEQQLGPYKIAPDVFKARAKLDVLQQGLVNTRLYLIDGNADEVLTFNLEEKPKLEQFLGDEDEEEQAN